MGSLVDTEISIMRGDNRTLTFTFVDSAGVAVNITGYTAFFTVKEHKSDLDAKAKIAKSWVSHSDPTNGITSLALVPADTLSLAGKYYFDVQLKSGGGLIYTPIKGIFTVVEDITVRTT